MHFTYFSGGANASSHPSVMPYDDASLTSPTTSTESGAMATVAHAVVRRKTSVSLPEMLREVTMEEFLQAIERVQETQLEDMDADEEEEDSDTREII